MSLGLSFDQMVNSFPFDLLLQVPFPFGMSLGLSFGGMDVVKASVLQSWMVMKSKFTNLNLVGVQVFAQLAK